MSRETQITDFDTISDEDFAQLDAGSLGIKAPANAEDPGLLEDRLNSPAPKEETAPAPASDPAAEAPGSDGEETRAEEEEGAEAEGEGEDGDDDPALEDQDDAIVEAAKSAPKKTTEKPADPAPKADGEPGAGEEEGGDAAAKDTTETAKSGETPDYEAGYKQIMAPFKANGRDFAPSSPEEAVRLMQMGANYTKKMQALQPNLKLMRMLQNNDLLDADKISFLIDLNQKNPQAIQKLLHDGKVDPLDLDVSSEPAYTPGNHAVSDEEMAFQDTLGTVMSTPEGKETVSHINTDWDHASKQAILKEPGLLTIIDEQRRNGVYAKICAEIDRQKTLGHLTNTPFIEAYSQIGERLQTSGQLTAQGGSDPSQAAQPAPEPAPAPAPQRQVLDTRPATRKPASTNGKQVRSVASAPGTPSKTARASFDPTEMTDDEIMSITSLKV